MEEIEKVTAPWVGQAQELLTVLTADILRVLTIQQALVIVGALFLAILVNSRARVLIEHLSAKNEAPVWRRVVRTASSISMPIAWVTGLWLSLLVMGGLYQPTALIRLVASLINAWVVIRIASTLIPSAFWSNVFAWIAWAIAALNAMGKLDQFIRWMDSMRFAGGGVNISLWGIVQGIIITGLLIFGAMVLSRFVQNRLENAKALNPSMRMLTTKLTKIAFLAIAVVFGMQAVGIDLTAFAVFSGALGLGVGLGMQRTVSNLVAGFTMLADRSIKPGDVIEITTGSGPTYGEVKSLGARYVSVLSRSGTETLIPNEILIANPVTNWSFTTRMVRRGIPVGVAYSTDVELAQQLCIEAALTCERVLKDPPVACQISGFGASSVDFDLRFWIADPEVGVANVESDVYLAVWKSFRANGIEIPFPQQDLHLRSVDPSIKMSRMVAE